MEPQAKVETPTQTPTATPNGPKVPKPARSFSIRLTAGAEQLVLEAYRTPAGWRTQARHVVGTGKAKKTERGATADHNTTEAARGALEAQAKQAEKNGWVRAKGHGGGFARKPDAFSQLPKPQVKK